MRKIVAVLAASLATTFAAGAVAQTKPEAVIKYRQSVYTVIGWNMRAMTPMMKGDKPYDKEAFARAATIVAQMAPLAMEGFAPGSDRGAPTEAKDEIWAKPADFKEKMDKLVAESGKLAQVAKAGSLDDIKKQFGATGAACKACHDEYKKK